MTRKEATEASDRVAEEIRKQQEIEVEKKRKEEAERDLYIRTGAVDWEIQQFHKLLPDYIKKGYRVYVVDCRHPITCQLVKDRLMAEGYTVGDTKHTYHPEYGGSADDGYAYAHDSYSEWSFTVSW